MHLYTLPTNQPSTLRDAYMRVTVKSYQRGIPSYPGFIAEILKPEVPLNLVQVNGEGDWYRQQVRGAPATFLVITSDYHIEEGPRPMYDKVVALLQKKIEQDANKQSGLVLTLPTTKLPLDPSLLKKMPVVREDDGKKRDKRPKIPFEKGKDLEVTMSDAAMQGSDVQQALASPDHTLADLIVYDLIDEAIQGYERKLASYSETADRIAREGGSIKAFYHPLMTVMKDPSKVARDKAALQKGIIVEGNRIVFPAALITPTMQPFLEPLLSPKPNKFTVRFITPKSDEGLERREGRLKKLPAVPAKSPHTHYYILGGVLLAAGATWLYMRRR